MGPKGIIGVGAAMVVVTIIINLAILGGAIWFAVWLLRYLGVIA